MTERGTLTRLTRITRLTHLTHLRELARLAHLSDFFGGVGTIFLGTVRPSIQLSLWAEGAKPLRWKSSRIAERLLRRRKTRWPR